jgi:hypothetical protein
VFFATPVILTVLRMLFPSQRHRMTCARWDVLSCFILTIMLDTRLRVKAKDGRMLRKLMRMPKTME